MKKIISIVILIFALFQISAQKQDNSFNINLISDSLKLNADAVTRTYDAQFVYSSLSSASETRSEVISVLNPNGKDIANFIYYGDAFRKLTSFSAKLYDANGKLLRRFKLSDVQSTEYSSSLADDARYYFFAADFPFFPITIHYEYTVDWKRGVLSFPAFYPLRGYRSSLEKATYKLTAAQDIEIRTKAFNIESEAKKTAAKGNNVCYEWKVENRKAIERESFMPDDYFFPLLFLRPVQFIYDKTPGTISDWQSYGLWEYDLVKGRDILPDELKNKIISLTEKASSDREKVKILYDFLGEQTRYVSIQLGIGGYQPMLASEVYKTGFGDCKALSNYLKAMLNAIGIPSYYAGIRSDIGSKQLFPDYPNFNQMNHAILQVPLPNDTLWLECTNTRVPFGFIHNYIAGHDALVVSEEGGKIMRLPDYADSLNVESFRVKVDLKLSGEAEVSVHKESRVKIYDNQSGIIYQEPSKQSDYLRRDINLPKVEMGQFTITEDKSALPGLFANYRFNTTLYGTKTANRLFIPVNAYRSNYDWIKKTKRTQDIYRASGYKDSDSIYINIPEGFEVESIPASELVRSPYGDFCSEIVADAEGINIRHILLVKSGRFSVSEYADYIAFFEKVNNAYKSKIILKKKQ